MGAALKPEGDSVRARGRVGSVSDCLLHKVFRNVLASGRKPFSVILELHPHGIPVNGFREDIFLPVCIKDRGHMGSFLCVLR